MNSGFSFEVLMFDLVQVSVILNRLKTFKIPVHPRIRIFYELLKVGMSNYAHRTADSLYVPNKYNELINPGNKEPWSHWNLTTIH